MVNLLMGEMLRVLPKSTRLGKTSLRNSQSACPTTTSVGATHLPLEASDNPLRAQSIIVN